IDLIGIDLCVAILLPDESTKSLGVDFLARGIRRQQNVGLIEGFPLGDDVTALEPLQHDTGKNQMRRRGADVDADAENANFILAFQRTSGAGKINAPALGFFDRHLSSPSSCRRAPRASTSLL